LASSLGVALPGPQKSPGDERLGVGWLLLLAEERSIVQGQSVIGVQANRRVIVLKGSGPVAGCGAKNTSAHQGFGIARIQLNGPVEILASPAHVTLRRAEHTTGMKHGGVRRIERDR